MNKYFLPVISIFILFQTFHIFDEIFFKEKNQKDKGYIIVKSTEQKNEIEKEEIKEKVNIDLLLQTANIEKGIKIEKSLKMLEEANRLRSNDGYITDSLGWALYKLKRYDKAKEYLKKENVPVRL